jgi:hypothetical protein
MLPEGEIEVSTDSHSQTAHALAASQVRLWEPPESDQEAVPEPTRNVKSTDVFEGAADTCMKPSSWRLESWKLVPTKGLPTQLPVEGFIAVETTTLSPDLHMRAALTPKNVPAEPSTWILTGVPSAAPDSVLVGVAPFEALAQGDVGGVAFGHVTPGLMTARVLVSGLPDVSAPAPPDASTIAVMTAVAVSASNRRAPTLLIRESRVMCFNLRP